MRLSFANLLSISVIAFFVNHVITMEDQNDQQDNKTPIPQNDKTPIPQDNMPPIPQNDKTPIPQNDKTPMNPSSMITSPSPFIPGNHGYLPPGYIPQQVYYGMPLQQVYYGMPLQPSEDTSKRESVEVQPPPAIKPFVSYQFLDSRGYPVHPNDPRVQNLHAFNDQKFLEPSKEDIESLNTSSPSPSPSPTISVEPHEEQNCSANVSGISSTEAIFEDPPVADESGVRDKKFWNDACNNIHSFPLFYLIPMHPDHYPTYQEILLNELLPYMEYIDHLVLDEILRRFAAFLTCITMDFHLPEVTVKRFMTRDFIVYFAAHSIPTIIVPEQLWYRELESMYPEFYLRCVNQNFFPNYLNSMGVLFLDAAQITAGFLPCDPATATDAEKNTFMAHVLYTWTILLTNGNYSQYASHITTILHPENMKEICSNPDRNLQVVLTPWYMDSIIKHSICLLVKAAHLKKLKYRLTLRDGSTFLIDFGAQDCLPLINQYIKKCPLLHNEFSFLDNQACHTDIYYRIGSYFKNSFRLFSSCHSEFRTFKGLSSGLPENFDSRFEKFVGFLAQDPSRVNFSEYLRFLVKDFVMNNCQNLPPAEWDEIDVPMDASAEMLADCSFTEKLRGVFTNYAGVRKNIVLTNQRNTRALQILSTRPPMPISPLQNFTVPPQNYVFPPQNFAAPPQNFAAPPQNYVVPPQVQNQVRSNKAFPNNNRGGSRNGRNRGARSNGNKGQGHPRAPPKNHSLAEYIPRAIVPGSVKDTKKPIADSQIASSIHGKATDGPSNLEKIQVVPRPSQPAPAKSPQLVNVAKPKIENVSKPKFVSAAARKEADFPLLRSPSASSVSQPPEGKPLSMKK